MGSCRLLVLAGCHLAERHFVPRRSRNARQSRSWAKMPAAGFVNLLRRTFRPPSFCGFALRMDSVVVARPQPFHFPNRCAQAVSSARTPRQNDRDPVNAYKAICAALKGVTLTYEYRKTKEVLAQARRKPAK